MHLHAQPITGDFYSTSAPCSFSNTSDLSWVLGVYTDSSVIMLCQTHKDSDFFTQVYFHHKKPLWIISKFFPPLGAALATHLRFPRNTFYGVPYSFGACNILVDLLSGWLLKACQTCLLYISLRRYAQLMTETPLPPRTPPPTKTPPTSLEDAGKPLIKQDKQSRQKWFRDNCYADRLLKRSIIPDAVIWFVGFFGVWTCHISSRSQLYLKVMASPLKERNDLKTDNQPDLSVFTPDSPALQYINSTCMALSYSAMWKHVFTMFSNF